MKVVWLGQSGLLFVSGKDKIIIDPYLTNDLSKKNSDLRRGMRLNKKFFRINPDIIILTNSSPDHTDTGTLSKYIYKSKKNITILCCRRSYEIIMSSDIPKKCNIVVFEEGSEWTFKHINITGVRTKSNDESGFGVLISDSTTGKVYYSTSATLYNKHIFEDLPSNIDTLFLPVNGTDGAMNMADAKRFAEKVSAVNTVPVHYGMFDMTDPEKFDFEGKIIPQIYRVINLDGNLSKKELSLGKQFDEQTVNKEVSETQKEPVPLLEEATNDKISSDATEKEDESFETDKVPEENKLPKKEEEYSSEQNDSEKDRIEENEGTDQSEKVDGMPEKTLDTEEKMKKTLDIKEENAKPFDVKDDNEKYFDTKEKKPFDVKEKSEKPIDISSTKESDFQNSYEEDSLLWDDIPSKSDISDKDSASEDDITEENLSEEDFEELFGDYPAKAPSDMSESDSDCAKENGKTVSHWKSENSYSYDADERTESEKNFRFYDDTSEEDDDYYDGNKSEEDEEEVKDIRSYDDTTDIEQDEEVSEEKEKSESGEGQYEKEEKDESDGQYGEEDEESIEEITQKLDAYMKEIEKFQRGDTADFSKIDDKSLK